MNDRLSLDKCVLILTPQCIRVLLHMFTFTNALFETRNRQVPRLFFFLALIMVTALHQEHIKYANKRMHRD